MFGLGTSEEAPDDPSLKVREEIDRKIKDAQIERGKFEKVIDCNRKLVAGLHDEVFGASPDRRTFSVNRIQSAVVTQTAVQTESPPRPIFRGRETNEPPEIFLRPESAFKLESLGEGHGLSEGQVAGTEVIPEPLFEMLAAQTVDQEQPNPRAGETRPGEPDQDGNQPDIPEPETIMAPVPVFDDEDFLFLTDELCAEALTQEHESEWEIAGCDADVSKWIFETNVIGWADQLIQWNDEKDHFHFTKLYPYHCWIDRWADRVGNASYFIIKRVLDVAEAKRDYPEHAEAIEKNGGMWGDLQIQHGVRGGRYDGASEREVIDRVTMWCRDYPYPRDEADALARGEVQQVPGEPVPVEQDGVVVGFEPGPPTLATADGEPTSPEMPNWPTRPGIRQVDMIADIVLYDGETEFADIPVARNLNIPVVESPYGQGEPERMYDLQDLYNRLWSIYHDYCLYYRSPEQMLPQSVVEAMKTELETLHSKGGRKLGVPDDLWINFQGQILQQVQPPQLNDTFFRIMGMLKDEMDTLSGIVGVLQGEAKSEWRSGAMVDSLTNNARGPIGYKARHTSEALKHAAKISANLIIDYLPIETWAKRNKKYPPAILEAMRNRLKTFGFDITVDVTGASSKESRANKLNNALANTPALQSSPTFMGQWADANEVSDADKIVQELTQGLAAPQQDQ